MFPLQRSGELFFKVTSESDSHHPPQQQHRIPRNLTFLDSCDPQDPSEPSGGVLVVANNKGKDRRRKICAASSRNEDAGVDEESTRKKKHREIEKQRRQEMASLYAELRSLLPLEYIKGKRSISDHMNEAVNYIKHLNLRIHKLNDQRDKLKRFSNSTSFDSSSGSDSTTCSRKCIVEINHLFDGTEVEIIISRGSKEEVEEDIPLSSVLQFLLERGLDVVNCFSTKVNERTLHKIHCEAASDAKSMDLSELQQKLDAVIKL